MIDNQQDADRIEPFDQDYDRRAAVRVSVARKVQIRPMGNAGEDDPFVEVKPINLSHGGLCIATKTVLSQLKRYEIQLSSDREEPIRLKARILWSTTDNRQFTYGLCFQQLTFHQQDTIFNLLSKGVDEKNSRAGFERRIGNRRFLMSSAAPRSLDHRKTERRYAARLRERKVLMTRFLTEDIKRLLYRRVVITGLGVISPLGNDKGHFLQALRSGTSGIKPLSRFEGLNFTCMLGGQVENFNTSDFFAPKRARQLDFSTQIILASAIQAMNDAGIGTKRENRRRLGVATGTVVGGLGWAFDQHDIYGNGGVKGMHPYTIAAASPNASSSEIAAEFGAQGPCVSFSQGCTSSSSAISYGYDQIRSGHADIMIAGGCEAPFIPSLYAAFDRAGILAHTNGFEHQLPKPFSKHRGGIILAEGAAVVILEDLDHAVARKATIYAEIVGVSQTCDGDDMLLQQSDGVEAAQAIQAAIGHADLQAAQVDAIFTHAPGSRDADLTEMKALQRVFGPRLKDVAIANVKSMIGYTQAATGAIECAAACLCIQNSFIPPVVHAEDMEIPLNIATEARPAQLNTVLINCFGFGGKNVCLLLRKYSE